MKLEAALFPLAVGLGLALASANTLAQQSSLGTAAYPSVNRL